jgi:hypothetical protein
MRQIIFSRNFILKHALALALVIIQLAVTIAT